MRIYPRVFRKGEKTRFFYESRTEAARVEIRVFGMERYSLPRTERMRIDEEVRHPLLPMERTGDRLFSIELTLPEEQCYTFHIFEDGADAAYGRLYAADEDLLSLGFYKGDTHLHSCRSDGVGTPFEVALSYRRAGFDFICLTDHHRYAPSLEARDAVAAITDAFTVFPGEEVHNRDMGYVHTVNFAGKASVNELIETRPEYVRERIAEILRNTDLPEDLDPATTGMRLFISATLKMLD